MDDLQALIRKNKSLYHRHGLARLGDEERIAVEKHFKLQAKKTFWKYVARGTILPLGLAGFIFPQVVIANIIGEELLRHHSQNAAYAPDWVSGVILLAGVWMAIFSSAFFAFFAWLGYESLTE